MRRIKSSSNSIAFGDYLRTVRLQLGLTTREVSKLSGYAHNYISTLEQGVRGTPSPNTIANVCKGLGVPYEHLMLKAGHFTIDDVKDKNNLEEFMPMSVAGSANKRKLEAGPKAPKLPVELFGEYLKQARISAGYNLDRISNKLGITAETFVRYEAGERCPTIASLKTLERRYGLKRYELTDRAGLDIREPEHEPVKAQMPMVEKKVLNLVETPSVVSSAPNDICAELLEELVKARTKHPKQFNSAHEGFAILNEEVEELWEDIKRDDSENARKELIQVGAMVIRFLLDVDFKKDKAIWTRIAPGEVVPVETKKKSWFGLGR